MIAAIDCGGTRIKLGLVEAGRVIARDLLPARSDGGLAVRLDDMAASLMRLAAGRPLAGVGLSIPGLIDYRRNRIAEINGKWLDAKDLDLSAWAQGALGAELRIENDANSYCLGEWSAGAAQGSSFAVAITLGTGLGCGVVLDGRPLRGAFGQAGIRSGHLTVVVGGHPCTCGNLGCAEAEASTRHLGEHASRDPAFPTSSLATVTPLDYHAVFSHASVGDALALRLRDRALAVWSTMVLNAVHAYDPEVVVLGGGIMASAEVILPAVQAHLDRHVWGPCGKPRLAQAALGDDAALIGVSALF